MSHLTPVTRTLNKEFKGRCPRITTIFAGSFVSIRANDPEGLVSCKTWDEVVRRAAVLLTELGAVPSTIPVGMGYHMDGVTASWSRN